MGKKRRSSVLFSWFLIFSFFLFGGQVFGVDATVTTTADETVSGEFQGLEENDFRVADKAFPMETLRDISFGKESVPQQTAALIGYRDNSQVRLGNFVLAEGTLRGLTAIDVAIDLPLRGVRSILFKSRDMENNDELQAEWKKLLDQETQSDILLLLREGKFQLYRGELLAINEKKIKFLLDGDLVDVNRERVFAIRVAPRPDESGDVSKTLAVLSDAFGSCYSVGKWVKVNTSEMVFETCMGTTVTLPVEKAAKIVFSAGKIVFLEIPNAEQVKWTPFISMPGMVTARDTFLAPKTNRSLNGNTLTIGGLEFERGLAMTSRSQVVFRLPDNAKRFLATVGIDDEVRPNGHVQLTISADDKTLFTGEINGTMEPLPLNLDVTKCARLTILVDYGSHMDISDHLDFGDARITP